MPGVFGVLGYPLAQSLSPYLHARAFAEAGLADTYTAWEIAPENLASFMKTFRETPFRGASVTIPHKEAVIPFLDGITEEAKTIGAVNTLYRDGGKLLGHNTDTEGFVAPLRSSGPFTHAAVLGAGGAARSVLAGLAGLGVANVRLFARNREKADRLAAEFAPRFASLETGEWDGREKTACSAPGRLLVVNATPLGMRGKAEGLSPLAKSAFTSTPDAARCTAYDIVYNPRETAFLADARAAGWETVDGLGMFVGQAAAQFRLWTGREMDVVSAHDFLAAKLQTASGG